METTRRLNGLATLRVDTALCIGASSLFPRRFPPAISKDPAQISIAQPFGAISMDLDVVAGDDEDLPLPGVSELDENGFPVDPVDPLSSSDYEEDVGAAGESEILLPGEGMSDFASDFYRSGADWSCLAAVAAEGGKEGRSLVQRDLFQMWGIKKMTPALPKDATGSPSRIPKFSSLPLPVKRRKLSFVEGRKDAADFKASGGKRNGLRKEGGLRNPRVCPFYKHIPGTPFTVDAFRYGVVQDCSGYFLSHFHYDHYGGLNKRWSHGPIYCTALTARLVKMCLSVDSVYICSLELNTEYVIEGVKVILLEANHCPGAAIILFQLEDGRSYLHTGDFRACKLMQSYPYLLNRHINVLYLDTTYCNPKYRFPPKEDVMDFVVSKTLSYLKKEPKTLIVVGAYSIGKEHVYLAISQAIGIPIYANSSRRRVLQSFDWPELSQKLCTSGQSSSLHVLPMSFLRHENLSEYLKTCKQQFKAVLAFRPTGWTYTENAGDRLDLIKPNSKGNVTIYGVPYSEHSSFSELMEFVKFLKPDKIIPTVNVGNPASRDKMQAYFREWLKT